jgi:hypothetical protein
MTRSAPMTIVGPAQTIEEEVDALAHGLAIKARTGRSSASF